MSLFNLTRSIPRYLSGAILKRNASPLTALPPPPSLLQEEFLFSLSEAYALFATNSTVLSHFLPSLG